MEELNMTNDQQRAMINRIAYNILDTVEGKKITKEFRKLYEGGIGAKNIDKKILNTDAIGLPNIADNVMEDGKIKDKFMTSTTHTAEVNGETISETVKEPDGDKMAEVTNRAIAITYAYAIFIELNRVQDELDAKDTKIASLEKEIESLKSDIKYLKSKIN